MTKREAMWIILIWEKLISNGHTQLKPCELTHPFSRDFSLPGEMTPVTVVVG